MASSRAGAVSAPRAIMAACGVWFAAQIQRVAPPAYLGASSIMGDLGITAFGAGLLASVYFPIYGLMQIPSGILADQGSPRRNLLIGGTLMVVAGLAFAAAPTLEAAVGARALIGLTAGLFWLSSLKLFATLPGGGYARRISFLVAVGSIASIVGMIGLPVLASVLHWRVVAALATVPMALISLLLLLVKTQDRPTPMAALWQRSRVALGRIPEIVSHRDFWCVALPTMVWTGTQFGVQTWLPRYARDALGVPAAATGLLPALLPLGMIAGSALLGYLHGRHRMFGMPMYFAFTVAYAIALAILSTGVAAAAGLPALIGLLVCLGILNAAFFLPLAWIGQRVAPEVLGTATGVLNGLTFLPAFVMPWLMGGVMDLVDRPTAADWQYSPQAFHSAFALGAGVIALALVAAAVLALRLRRPHDASVVGSGRPDPVVAGERVHD
jgi:predicted MFS family arabinose efflux permease